MSKQDDCKLSVVGQYNDQFNNILGIVLPCSEIFQSDGLIIHIANKHLDYVVYANKISDIINHPDFIGCHPTIPSCLMNKQFRISVGNGHIISASVYW